MWLGHQSRNAAKKSGATLRRYGKRSDPSHYFFEFQVKASAIGNNAISNQSLLSGNLFGANS